MKEIWLERRVGGNYSELAEEYGTSPVLARILANRGIKGKEAVREFLTPGLSAVLSYDGLPDIGRAVSILMDKIDEGRAIRVIGDYDIDGVCATYILVDGLRKAGAAVDHAIPHRIRDGYGLNEELIRSAHEDGADTIITCDNGIAALHQIALAKELGMTVIVTDHHEVPFHEEEGRTVYDLPPADAVVDIKRNDSRYPFREICGAAVAFKLILALFDALGIEESEAAPYLEFAAFATVGDVMPLTEENRALVTEGLKRLEKTENPGMRALIKAQELEGKPLTPYHVGFILGPCINATGRLDTAENALKLLMAENEAEAGELARLLVTLNIERREMTDRAVKEAVGIAESDGRRDDKVLVIFLPDCHESVAGIVAGKVRERTGKPSFVLSRGESAVKGSGRSIDEYDMYRGMNAVSDLFLQFGGHKMAGGLSIEEEKVEEFRRRINECCTLTEDDLALKVRFDLMLPFAYAGESLADELEKLAPFGMGNARPLFAMKNVRLTELRICGKNRNCLKAVAKDEKGAGVDAVYFGDAEALGDYMTAHQTISIIYSLEMNEYRGKRAAEITIRYYR